MCVIKISTTFLLLTWCAVSFAAPQEVEVPTFEFKPVKELPADIPTCSENDLNVNDCIKQAFQQLTPRLKNGIKELNVPPMDPLLIEKTAYTYSSGIVQGRIQIRNMRMYGLSEAITDKVNFQLKNGKVSLEILSHVPKIFVEGAYKADIKLNEIKMTPKGYFNVTMTDIVTKARPVGELYDRDGHTYLRLKKLDSEPKIGDMRIYASGLVPDPSLNAVLLDFVNQYWRQIYESILPETLKTWEPLSIKTANEFFAALPFDLILTKN